MSSFRIRPRFAHTLDCPPDETRRRLLDVFAAPGSGFEVKEFPGYISVFIGAEQRRFWSPRLSLSFEAAKDGATRIAGTYGPDAELWSLFLYGYLMAGLAGTFAGIWGVAQVMVHQPPWGLWVLAAMAGLAALLYLGAQLGQKLGAWQTFQLHQAYQRAAGRPAEIT